jgi:DNA-binding transcriptional regulator YiaG
MKGTTVKKEAKKIVERLPEDSSWDDLMHQIYVRQSIESGLKDSQAGRLTDVKDIRKEYGLKK